MKAKWYEKSSEGALERLVEDIGLKIHLAGMDTKSAWESLKPDIDALRASLKRARPKKTPARKGSSPARLVAEEAKLQAHLAALDASEQWESIEGRLAPILDHLVGAGRSLADATNIVGDGKARREEAARKREEVKNELRHTGEHLRAAGADGLAILRDALDSLVQRLESGDTRTQPPAA